MLTATIVLVIACLVLQLIIILLLFRPPTVTVGVLSQSTSVCEPRDETQETPPALFADAVEVTLYACQIGPFCDKAIYPKIEQALAKDISGQITVVKAYRIGNRYFQLNAWSELKVETELEPTPVSKGPAGVFRNGDRVRIDGVDTDLQGATATVESEDGQSVIVDLDKGFRTVVHHTFLTKLLKAGDKVKVVNSHSEPWVVGQTGIVETVYDDGSITVTIAGLLRPFNDASQLELVP